MIATAGLARAVEEGLALLAPEPEVSEVEVFASANCALLARLAYASHVPSNGVEEPKSTEMAGLGVQAVFDGPDGRALIGFGSEPSDLTPEGALRALAKARQAAVHDPEFRSRGVAVMAGHDAGLIAVGKTIGEAARRVLALDAGPRPD